MESLIDSFRLWNMEEDSSGFIEFAKEVLLIGKYTDENDSPSILSQNHENDERNSQNDLIKSNSCELSGLKTPTSNNSPLKANMTAKLFEITVVCSNDN